MIDWFIKKLIDWIFEWVIDWLIACLELWSESRWSWLPGGVDSLLVSQIKEHNAIDI